MAVLEIAHLFGLELLELVFVLIEVFCDLPLLFVLEEVLHEGITVDHVGRVMLDVLLLGGLFVSLVLADDLLSQAGQHL